MSTPSRGDTPANDGLIEHITNYPRTEDYGGERGDTGEWMRKDGSETEGQTPVLLRSYGAISRLHIST
ncbi:hypothetical protein B7463_g1358, partial [Scytalidium lignicola]